MCDVALAAKHPQPAAFGAFLERASILQLYDRYCLSRVHGHPDSAFEELKMALLQETTRVAVPVQQCAHDMDKSTAFLWLNSMSSQKNSIGDAVRKEAFIQVSARYFSQSVGTFADRLWLQGSPGTTIQARCHLWSDEKKKLQLHRCLPCQFFG